ncbi:MAG: hypothetical protein NC254_10655 [bacterium]|nr:hypothetical protein [bacterium]
MSGYAGNAGNQCVEDTVKEYEESNAKEKKEGGTDNCTGIRSVGRICCLLAVLPLDAFTGKPIPARDFIVEIDGARPPVRKRDGFFVFLQGRHSCPGQESPPPEKEDALIVRLKGRGYQEAVLHVPVGFSASESPVITVRMNPDASYPFPAQTICMAGRLSEHCCLRAALLQKKSSLRLAEDYHAGEEWLCVYRGEQTSPAGGLFYIEAGAVCGGCGEFVLFSEAESGETGRYRLSAPMTGNYDRRTARLYPARMQKTGEREESYFFAFRTDKGAASGVAAGGHYRAAGDKALDLGGKAPAQTDGCCNAAEDRALDSGGKTPAQTDGCCNAAEDRALDPGGKTPVQTGCDILCRVETADGIKEHRFFAACGETKKMDF